MDVTELRIKKNRHDLFNSKMYKEGFKQVQNKVYMTYHNIITWFIEVHVGRLPQRTKMTAYADATRDDDGISFVWHIKMLIGSYGLTFAVIAKKYGIYIT